MKKLAIGIVLLVMFISFCCGVNAAGFTTNSDAIEKAADSVLLIAGPQASDSNIISRGSGFVAFNSSILITNYHVIDGVSSMLAWDDEDDNFEHGYEIKYVLCADKEADIAILEFAEPTRLQPLDLYPDDGLKRGSPVLAIGSPGGGAKNTVSSGIISSQYINSKGVPEIQTTAAISHGSSGGALFNDDGKVIGVTTATSAVEETQNINFAINIAVAKAMYNAWDGTRYTFSNHKSVAKMDYTGVYDHQNQSGSSAVVVTDVPAEPDAGSTESWTCLNCGHENTTKFCLECGAEKPYWICSCGRTNSSSKFCGDCGKSLAEQIESFNNAMKDASEHKYPEAITALESLGLFDSGSFETSEGPHAIAKDFIPKLYYDQGKYLQANNGSYEEIIASFEKAGDYSDAKEQIQGENARYLKSLYDAGVDYLANGEYEAAVETFKAVGDYQDAKEKIKEAYYSQGLDLLEKKEYDKSRDALRYAGIYKNASEVIKKAFYLEAIDLMEQREYDKALVRLNNASGYSDSMEKIKEVYYLQAVEALSAGNAEKAKVLFKRAGDYKDAKERLDSIRENSIQNQFNNLNSDPETMSADDEKSLKILLSDLRADKSEEEALLEKRINFILGQYYNIHKDFYLAAQMFKKADDYLDAKDQCFQSKVLCIKDYIEQGKISDAIKYYDANKEQMTTSGTADQFIVIEPGSRGEIVNEILRLLTPVGIKNKIPAEEETYKVDYTVFVQKLEEHFGLIADGKITLDDYVVLRNAVCVGQKSDRVRGLFEKLADLSYLGKLPKEHNVYEAKYINGVKKAEQALNLLVDGIVTQKEYEIIMAQNVEPPAIPRNLTATVKNDTVTLTWPNVPGAVLYEVQSDNSNDNEFLAGAFRSGNSATQSYSGTTEKNRIVFENVETGVKYKFVVIAKKYTVSSGPRTVVIEVPIYFKPATAKDLNTSHQSFKKKYVKLNGLRVVSWQVKKPDGTYSNEKTQAWYAQKNSNYDLLLLGKTGNYYVEVVLTNYKGWGWKSNQTDPAGLASSRKLKTVSVEATVLSDLGIWGEVKNVPKVNAITISWTY